MLREKAGYKILGTIILICKFTLYSYIFIYTFISGKKYAEILPTPPIYGFDSGDMASCYFLLHLSLCFQNLL